MVKHKQDNIKRATFYVMIILAFSRILGFVREMLIAKVYGRGLYTDAFFAAFSIPDFMYDLLVAGALSSGFMPVFTSYLAKDDEDGAWKAANTFITVAIIFILIFNLFGITFTKGLVPLVAFGSLKDPVKYALTVKLTRIMFSAVTFTVLAGLCKGILESYKRFTTPALGPVLYNVGFILGGLLLGKQLGIYGLAIGVIVGAMMNLGVQLPEFFRVGSRFNFSLETKNEGYKKMLVLMGPALLALAVNRINLLVNQNVASVLDTGSLTALRYAQRIMMLPVGIFGASIMTTIFPLMNMHIAKKENEEYKDTLSLGLRSLLYLTIPCTFGLIVLNVPIVKLLFMTGKFTAQDAAVTALALAFYSIGVIGNSTVPIIIRGFYSIQDTKTPLKIGIIIVIVNTLLNLLFVKFSSLAVGGIAISSSAAALLEFILLYKIFGKRMNGLRTRELLITSIKSIISAFIMSGAAFITSKLIESKLGTVSKFAQIADVGGAIAVAVIVYFGVSYALAMPELDFFMNIVRKRIKK
jgi:putative peptidoglycan lipid II flippase